MRIDQIWHKNQKFGGDNTKTACVGDKTEDQWDLWSVQLTRKELVVACDGVLFLRVDLREECSQVYGQAYEVYAAVSIEPWALAGAKSLTVYMETGLIDVYTYYLVSEVVLFYLYISTRKL